ncbi:MAG: phosphoglycerate dehydrogenase [Clostridiales Family XIII bacterium]|jgi:D-3-phosphoglycerate dehydrogenase|nr:phosphoglycerate dehydrogenase [Clostridiales Family XIII bacterium]
MRKRKILITPRSFAKNDDSSIKLLEKNGLTPVLNPRGQIMSEDEMIEIIKDCEGVIIGIDPLTKRVLENAKILKAVAKYGVGTDNIDLIYLKKNGIKMSITRGANSEAVADYAFSLMLALARKVILIDKKAKEGNWGKITTHDVARKTLGLIGLGDIGKNMAKRAQGFDMKIIATDLFWDEKYAEENNIEKKVIDELMCEADFISLHIPLSPDTKNLINQRRINLMKSSAFIVNTARGGLIDENALLIALKSKKIAGAGIDAFSVEPPEDKRWFLFDNIIIGSHAAASTIGAANNMSMMAAKNIINDLK